MAYFMKIAHTWVRNLHLAEGATHDDDDDEEPPASRKKLTLQNFLKKVFSAGVFELGYENSTKIRLKGSQSWKYAIFAPKMVKNGHFSHFWRPPIPEGENSNIPKLV